MFTRSFFTFVCLTVLSSAALVRADFVLTDKNDANGVTIATGYTASSTYIMETQYNNAFLPSTPGATAGFRFNDQNSSPANLLTSPDGGADLRQGFVQSLTGNEENGYVGTVVGKAWGNAVTLTLGNHQLVNLPVPDLYVTIKSLSGQIAQNTSATNKSMCVGFHMIDGPNPGWHLYNPTALPASFQPAQGVGNVLGAIDLSSLPLSAGNFLDADLPGITTTIPLGTTIDKIILVNSNSANDHAFGFLGTTAEAPTGFVARRDFDNADLDGDGFTGVDYLTGRYGTRPTNGQDGPQAWFVGIVPEPTSLALLPIAGLLLARRARRH